MSEAMDLEKAEEILNTRCTPELNPMKLREIFIAEGFIEGHSAAYEAARKEAFTKALPLVEATKKFLDYFDMGPEAEHELFNADIELREALETYKREASLEANSEQAKGGL